MDVLLATRCGRRVSRTGVRHRHVLGECPYADAIDRNLPRTPRSGTLYPAVTSLHRAFTWSRRRLHILELRRGTTPARGAPPVRVHALGFAERGRTGAALID